MGSFHVPDDMLLKQAADALPPLKGSWIDLVGDSTSDRSQKAIEIGRRAVARLCNI